MYIPGSNAADIVSAAQTVECAPDESVMILIGDNGSPDPAELVQQLNSAGIRFFGGVFPALVSGTQCYFKGTVLKPVPLMADPHIIKGLDEETFTIPAFPELSNLPADADPTAFVFVDGLTANIVMFLQKMFQTLGTSVHYVGGGAGSLSLKQAPVLFTPECAFQDAALVAVSPLKSGLGVRHGWERLAGPVVATRTEKNVIAELNWQSAFDVYRDVVEEDSGKQFDGTNFMDLAKSYPLGMLREGVEDVVRDPLSVNDDGEIVSVGEVPENTAMYILKGNPEDLPVAAGRAAEESMQSIDSDIRTCMVVDCISRPLYLGDDISKELEAVKSHVSKEENEVELFGVFSLGEISSYGEGLPEFFNKTIVVGALHE